jgi:hypothetical protein
MGEASGLRIAFQTVPATADGCKYSDVERPALAWVCDSAGEVHTLPEQWPNAWSAVSADC